MSYVTLRLFTGTSDQTPQALDRLVQAELLPQLNRTGGLLQYTTLQTTDGRLGSFSLYQDQAAAEQGRQIAASWITSTGVMRNYQLDTSYQGEVVLGLRAQDQQVRKDMAGIARIYPSEGSIEDIRAAFEEQRTAIQALAGFVGFTAAKLDGQRVGTFSTFRSREEAAQLTNLARQTRAASGSRLARLLPSDPQTIEVTVINSYLLNNNQTKTPNNN